MSDVPELDRLISEHDLFQHNIAWMRHEARQYFGFRLMVASVPTAAICTVFGLAGAAAAPAIWRLTERIVPKPKWRDPFRRYMTM